MLISRQSKEHDLKFAGRIIFAPVLYDNKLLVQQRDSTACSGFIRPKEKARDDNRPKLIDVITLIIMIAAVSVGDVPADLVGGWSSSPAFS